MQVQFYILESQDPQKQLLLCQECNNAHYNLPYREIGLQYLPPGSCCAHCGKTPIEIVNTPKTYPAQQPQPERQEPYPSWLFGRQRRRF